MKYLTIFKLVNFPLGPDKLIFCFKGELFSSQPSLLGKTHKKNTFFCLVVVPVRLGGWAPWTTKKKRKKFIKGKDVSNKTRQVNFFINWFFLHFLGNFWRQKNKPRIRRKASNEDTCPEFFLHSWNLKVPIKSVEI